MTEDPFSSLEPPEPPVGLREAAVAAGRAALRTSTVEVRADLWTRLFRSTPARLAWAASVTLLSGAHLRLSLTAAAPPGTSAPATAAAVSEIEPEVAAIARLPRIEDRALDARAGESS